MACACKQAKILEKKYGSVNSEGKRDTKYYVLQMGKSLTYILLNRIFMPIILFSICIIVFPVLLVMLIITQIVGGQAKVIVPQKFLSKMKEALKNHNNEEIIMSKIEVSGE